MPIDPRVSLQSGTPAGAQISIADLDRRLRSLEATSGTIGANAITAGMIGAGAVGAGVIAAGAILSYMIAADQIIANHISANSINAGHIQAGSIDASHIQANAITANAIQAGAINATHIATEQINTGHLQANSITTEKIAANAVTANEIAANSITTEKIAAGTVIATEIQADTITAAMIKANAIETVHIKAEAVTSNKIAANAITSDKIAAGAVTAGAIFVDDLSGISGNLGTINAGTITGASIRTASGGARVVMDSLGLRGYGLDGTTKVFEIDAGSGVASFTGVAYLDPSSVVPGEVLDPGTIPADRLVVGSITTLQLAAGSVKSNNIDAGAIQAQHITVGSVGQTHIADGAITTEKITTGAILASKINVTDLTAITSTFTSLTSGTISGATITGTTINGGTINGTTITATATITGSTINGADIVGGTVTGGVIRTSSTGGHVELNTNGLYTDERPTASRLWMSNAGLKGYSSGNLSLEMDTRGNIVNYTTSGPLAINVNSTTWRDSPTGQDIGKLTVASGFGGAVVGLSSTKISVYSGTGTFISATGGSSTSALRALYTDADGAYSDATSGSFTTRILDANNKSAFVRLGRAGGNNDIGQLRVERPQFQYFNIGQGTISGTFSWGGLDTLNLLASDSFIFLGSFLSNNGTATHNMTYTLLSVTGNNVNWRIYNPNAFTVDGVFCGSFISHRY